MSGSPPSEEKDVRRTGHLAAGLRAAVALVIGVLAIGPASTPWSTAAGRLAEADRPQDLELQVVGSIGGRGTALAVRGNLVYLAVGSDLEVIDISDPAAPMQKGTSRPLPGDRAGDADDIELAGSYAYVVDEWDNLRVFDISVPRWPAEVARLALRFGDGPQGAIAADIELAGRYALVTSGLRPEVLVVDFGNPLAPEQVASVPMPGLAGDLVIRGQQALLLLGEPGAGSGRLEVLDASAPPRLTPVGALDLGAARPVGIAQCGGLAYIADGAGKGWLHVADVRDPARPLLLTSVDQVLGDVDKYHYLEGVWCRSDGGTVYLSDRSTGHQPSRLLVADVASPTAPVFGQAVALDPNMSAYDVHGSPGRLLLTVDSGRSGWSGDSDPGGSAGLRILAPAASGPPAEVGRYVPVKLVSHPVSDGHWVYAGGATERRDESTLQVIDAADPTRPMRVSSLRVGRILAMSLLGNSTLLATTIDDTYDYAPAGSLLVVDVTDPRRPRVVATLPVPGTPHALAVFGQLALVLSSFLDAEAPDQPIVTQLDIVDVAELASPRRLARVPCRSRADALAVAGDAVYVAGSLAGDVFDLVDIRNPDHPVTSEVDMVPGGSGECRLPLVSGNHLFCTGGGGEGQDAVLEVYDIAARHHPSLLTIVVVKEGNDLGVGRADVLTASGRWLLLGRGSEATLVDATNPAQPLMVDTVTVGTPFSDLPDASMPGCHAFVAADRSGLASVAALAPMAGGRPTPAATTATQSATSGVRVYLPLSFAPGPCWLGR